MTVCVLHPRYRLHSLAGGLPWEAAQGFQNLHESFSQIIEFVPRLFDLRQGIIKRPLNLILDIIWKFCVLKLIH